MIPATRTDSGSNLNSSDIRLLAAIGFIAARAGLADPGRKIFEALALERPECTFPYIGLALTNLCIGDAQNAVEILKDRGLSFVPNNPELHAWLAIAYKYSGHMECSAQICKKLQSEDCGSDSLHDINKTLSEIIATISRDSLISSRESRQMAGATE